MATSTDKVYVEIIAKTNEAVAGLANFTKALVAVGVSWMAFKKVIVDSFKEYMKSEDAQTRLGAAIRITGQQATASVSSLARYANQLQKITNYEDEASMAAMGVLMQLGNLTEKGVKEALPLLQDFAAFWGMDLVQAAELFGKTLGSSVNALGRYGIELEKNLTSDQKLVSVLGQMKTGMGGFAKEMATTTSGQLKAMKIQIDELKESFGGFLAALSQTDVVKKSVEGLGRSFDQMAWAMEGYKIKLEDINKMSRAQLINYNTELNNVRQQFEEQIIASQKRIPSLSSQFANRELALIDKYKKEIVAIESQMASVNRALRTAAPSGGAQPGALTTAGGGATQEEVIAARLKDATEWLSDSQRAYNQDLANGAVSLDSYNAAMYVLEQRSIAAAEAQEKHASAIDKMVKIAEASAGVSNPPWANEDQEAMAENIARYAEDAADALSKIQKEKLTEAFETIANLTVDIAETMGAAFASGDILSGLNAVAQKILSMFSVMALEAAFGAARDGLWPLALGFLAIAGVTAFGGGAMGALGGNGGNGGIGVPQMASGGIVTRPTLALIGEAGPEAVVPLGRGVTGDVNIIVQGSVWQTEDLARAVAGAMGRW